MLVRLNGTLRGQTGRHKIDVAAPETATVAATLAALIDTTPALQMMLFERDDTLRANIVIFRNGRNIEFLGGLDAPIEPTHVLDIFPRTGVQRALLVDPPA